MPLTQTPPTQTPRTPGIENSENAICAELETLAKLSAKLGSDRLLVQASSGNTSLKLDGKLWIKASGKWLQRAAEDDIFVPVDLAQARSGLAGNEELCCWSELRGGMRASIETAMHAVLPHRVVIHVHSVKTLSWAVRIDGRERLSERLAGIAWQWIPYVASGLPLAQAIRNAVATAPRTNVFVLANHGLVVCGEDCEAAEALLSLVEARVATQPRLARACDPGLLAEIAGSDEWRMPAADRIHCLATDPASLAAVTSGVLYPCQAMFLGTTLPVLSGSTTFLDGLRQVQSSATPPFWIVEGRGLVLGRSMTTTQLAILDGLVEVVQRIEPSAQLRYIDDEELTALLTEDAHGYRQSAESNA